LSESLKGTFTLNSNHTGTRIGTSVQVDHNFGPSGEPNISEVNTLTFSESFTWSQDSSGEITITFGTTTFNVSEGARGGDSFSAFTPTFVFPGNTVPNPPYAISGLGSEGGMVLGTSAASERTYFVGNTTEVEIYGVCEEADTLLPTRRRPHY
jgi:hypothetical protein